MRTAKDYKKLIPLVTDPFKFTDYFFKDEAGWQDGFHLPKHAQEVFDLINKKHPQSAILLPRGHMKSVLVARSYVLFLALNNPGTNILVITNEARLSKKIGRAHDHQLKNNSKLKEVYGDQVNSKDNKWTEEYKELKNGSVIEYSSTGKAMRGNRPDIIVLDDIETTEQARSATQTEHLDEWLYKDVEPALKAHGRMILLGTIISTISFANRIATGEIPDWEVLLKSACDFNTGEVLWPENAKFAHIDLFKQKKDRAAAMNRLSDFYSEYMNIAIEDEEAKFTPNMISYFNELPSVPLRAFCTIDLAYTKKKHSDKTAWIVGYTDYNNDLYIVEARKAKLDLEEREQLVFNLALKYDLHDIHIEGHTDFFSSIEREQRRRKLQDSSFKYFKLTELKARERGSKTDHILGLQPNLKTMKFKKGHCDEVIDELLLWTPSSTVDDGADALAYIRRIALPAEKGEKEEGYIFIPKAFKRPPPGNHKKTHSLAAKRPTTL